MGLLRELRFVANEVGLTEARRMPTEVRRWWIDEIQRERNERDQGVTDVNRKRSARGE